MFWIHQNTNLEKKKIKPEADPTDPVVNPLKVLLLQMTQFNLRDLYCYVRALRPAVREHI